MTSKYNDDASRRPTGKETTYGSINVEMYPNESVDYPETGRTRQRLPFLMLGAVVGVLILGLSASSSVLYAIDQGSLLSISSMVPSLALWGKAKKAEGDIAHYYDHQLIDHNLGEKKKNMWSHKYYRQKKYFGGPGNPIFMVLGGEGAMTGMFYPFITNHLAKQFHAYVIQPGHRFYGRSMPLKWLPKTSDLERLLTSDQALKDFVRLVQHTRTKLGCSLKKSSPKYCPVITVGGSYPGFLSAMMRLVYPDVVDIAYAASAPLKLYGQQVDYNTYYDYITMVTDKAFPGCAAAMKESLTEMTAALADSVGAPALKLVAEAMNICVHKIPKYIDNDALFAREIAMIVGYTMADSNMDFYPPTSQTAVGATCAIFRNSTRTALQKIGDFLASVTMHEEGEESPGAWQAQKDPDICFDMSNHEPEYGRHRRISSGDWSGLGPGKSAYMWEFQCCTQLIIGTGFSAHSMFIERPFTLEFLTDHCQKRFGVTPKPTAMVDAWGFDDLVGAGASRILFTNGANDGWIASSYTTNLTDTIVALKFPNGAHHSDLSHNEPSADDTDDIKAGRVQIASILGEWLEDIKNEEMAL